MDVDLLLGTEQALMQFPLIANNIFLMLLL